jgi:hypothetical protein
MQLEIEKDAYRIMNEPDTVKINREQLLTFESFEGFLQQFIKLFTDGKFDKSEIFINTLNDYKIESDLVNVFFNCTLKADPQIKDAWALCRKMYQITKYNDSKILNDSEKKAFANLYSYGDYNCDKNELHQNDFELTNQCIKLFRSLKWMLTRTIRRISSELSLESKLFTLDTSHSRFIYSLEEGDNKSLRLYLATLDEKFSNLLHKVHRSDNQEFSKKTIENIQKIKKLSKIEMYHRGFVLELFEITEALKKKKIELSTLTKEIEIFVKHFAWYFNKPANEIAFIKEIKSEIAAITNFIDNILSEIKDGKVSNDIILTLFDNYEINQNNSTFRELLDFVSKS